MLSFSLWIRKTAKWYSEFEIFLSLGNFLFTQLLHFLCCHLIMHIQIGVLCSPFYFSLHLQYFISYLFVSLLYPENLWEGKWITIINSSQNVFLVSTCSITVQCYYFGFKYSWRIHASNRKTFFFLRLQWFPFICFLVYRSHMSFFTFQYSLSIYFPQSLFALKPSPSTRRHTGMRTV